MALESRLNKFRSPYMQQRMGRRSLRVAIDAPSVAVTNLVFALLITRCVLDIVFPGIKPGIAVLLYLAQITIFILMQLTRKSAMGIDYVLCLALPLTTLTGIVNAPYAIDGQINFGSQCFIPVIFLLLISRSRSVDFCRLRHLFLRYGMGTIFICVAFALWSQDYRDLDALEYLNDNPMHTTAQLLAKASLVIVEPMACGSWVALVGAFMTTGALAVLNVRSTMLGFMGSIGTASRKFLLLCFLGAAVLAVLAITDFGLLNGFFDRFLFKGRDFLGDSFGNITSGRTDRIWPYYIQRLTEASPHELLFGQGALWLFSNMVLFAHNDFLTIAVSYGLVGLALYSIAWFLILSRIAHPFRYPSIVMFLILVATNGVVSYQSNVLFALFYGGGVLISKRDRVLHDEHKKWAGSPAVARRSSIS